MRERAGEPAPVAAAWQQLLRRAEAARAVPPPSTAPPPSVSPSAGPPPSAAPPPSVSASGLAPPARDAGPPLAEPDDGDEADDVAAETASLQTLLAPVALAGPDLVIGQLGQSLDGRVATRTGDACHVTGPADRRHLHRLRALVDAVVVGVGTVVADDPQLSVRDVAGSSPVRVVLDPRGRAPRGARVLTDGAPTLWLVGADAVVGEPPAAVRVLRLPGVAGGPVPPAAVLALLARLGLRRVLVEGGGRTVSAFLAAGSLDRLHLTVAPVVLGHDGVPGLSLPGPALARDALRPPSRPVPLGRDVCFDLDLRAAAQPEQRDGTG